MQTQMAFDTTYYPLVVVSCLFFLLTWHFLSPRLSNYFIPSVKTLSESKLALWHSSTISSFHAVIASFLCVYALFYVEKLKEDPVWHDSPLVKSTCALVTGYMFSDSIIMVINYRHYGDIYLLLHHAASVYAFFYVMTYNVFGYFSMYRLMAEFSTPWVNNRWMLDNLGFDKTGPIYFWNGIILTAVFFGCRIASLPGCWYTIYSIYNTEAYLRTGCIGFVLLSSCFVLDVLNLFWFFKLLKGVHKTLKKTVDANKNVTTQKVE